MFIENIASRTRGPAVQQVWIGASRTVVLTFMHEVAAGLLHLASHMGPYICLHESIASLNDLSEFAPIDTTLIWYPGSPWTVHISELYSETKGVATLSVESGSDLDTVRAAVAEQTRVHEFGGDRRQKTIPIPRDANAHTPDWNRVRDDDVASMHRFLIVA
ncbi:hypothetical protein CONLIGDRAFT_685752 [Coniochaeta ligniaria NRRL 30616]|uniref:Uncharacterized protein n=1 Tax=Coniochaeta ligniaria NRRL 30616 TaxID=1408157 RepID=A0A1J7I901_9PEZI|nr:hypothetical protein CONLIGDRAFT_685752 [Coniochaeta ligniaria NRRL 30616]